MRRFVFNPQHDLCLADGGVSFIPPASVVEFAQRCSWIERFMERPSRGEDKVPSRELEEIVPWGWNRTLREQMLKEGYPQELMPTDAQLDFIREFSRREMAVELLDFVHKGLQAGEVKNLNVIPSDYRVTARSMEEIEEFLHSRGRVVLKAPLSGSGKGIRFCTGELMETDRGWCRRVLQRQGAVIVEERREVVQEFAMLFEVGESVRFVGYSLFYAANGAYKGNLLASNEYILQKLGDMFPVEELQGVRAAVERFLEGKLLGKYKGFVGVDQFLCKGNGAEGNGAEGNGAEGKGFEGNGAEGNAAEFQGEKYLLNPAVEINLRMTMGLIARNIYDFYRGELGLEDATHCFEPEKGIFKCS